MNIPINRGWKIWADTADAAVMVTAADMEAVAHLF